LTDSRTAIYTDVFTELSKQNSYILGLGGNGKTNTSLIYDESGDYDKIYKEGRRGTESGMLNHFQYSGIIGAFSYWLLLAASSFKAIFKSNNHFCKMLGLFMAFKVFYSFVEDQIMVNVESFYLMFLIGMCSNWKFRGFKDIEIKKRLNFIFR